MDLRRSVNTKIWSDVWFETISTEEKLLWIYLITNSSTNMLGVYELSERKMSFESGLSLDSIRKAFKGFESLKKAKYINGYVVLYNWIKNQSFNTNMKKSALSDYEKLPNTVKLSIKSFFDNKIMESFGTLSKDLLILPKNEKENESEEEDESEEKKADRHNDSFRKLYESKKWIETVCISLKCEEINLKNHLNGFRLSLLSKKDYKKTEEDAASHFINWVNRGNEVPKNNGPKGSETFDGF
jgi:hypothetical protein